MRCMCLNVCVCVGISVYLPAVCDVNLNMGIAPLESIRNTFFIAMECPAVNTHLTHKILCFFRVGPFRETGKERWDDWLLTETKGR